jgi:transposase, IS5 family
VGQLGFYDLDKHLEAISAKGDPLEALNLIIPFESFRSEIEAVVRLAPEERKCNAARKPFDAVMMFKVLVLQMLYNLADEHVEYPIRDRLSFMRFLGLGLEDRVPDATTVWLFREALTKAGLVKTLFAASIATLMPRATLRVADRLSMPPSSARPSSATRGRRTRRSRQAKLQRAGKQSLPRTRRRTRDARWTKKNEQSFYGYKNHISVDRKHKLIRRYAETDASAHDSQKLDEILDRSNTSNEVWADSAYRSRDRSQAQGEGLQEPHPSSRRPQPLVVAAPAG